MAIPDSPLTRSEEYLNNIATGEGAIPDVPLTRIEQYLDYIAKNGGSGGGGSGGAKIFPIELRDGGQAYLPTGLSVDDFGGASIYSDIASSYSTIIMAMENSGSIMFVIFAGTKSDSNRLLMVVSMMSYNPETGEVTTMQ